MRVRFVYHNAKDSWLGKGIVGWTYVLALIRLDFKSLKFNFSHCEVWFPQQMGIVELKSKKTESVDFFEKDVISWGLARVIGTRYVGQCFSSTTRGDAEGVRFSPASKVLHHPDRWVYQEYEVSEVRVKQIMPKLKAKVGNPYDFDMIKGFLLPWEKGDPDAEICSEICGWVAWLLSIVRFRAFGRWEFKISPRRLAKVLGGELHEVIK